MVPSRIYINMLDGVRFCSINSAKYCFLYGLTRIFSASSNSLSSGASTLSLWKMSLEVRNLVPNYSYIPKFSFSIPNLTQYARTFSYDWIEF